MSARQVCASTLNATHAAIERVHAYRLHCLRGADGEHDEFAGLLRARSRGHLKRSGQQQCIRHATTRGLRTRYSARVQVSATRFFFPKLSCRSCATRSKPAAL